MKPALILLLMLAGCTALGIVADKWNGGPTTFPTTHPATQQIVNDKLIGVGVFVAKTAIVHSTPWGGLIVYGIGIALMCIQKRKPDERKTP